MSEDNKIILDKAPDVEAKERNAIVYGLYGIWAISALWAFSSLLVVFLK
jgi:hypothetical protein